MAARSKGWDRDKAAIVSDLSRARRGKKSGLDQGSRVRWLGLQEREETHSTSQCGIVRPTVDQIPYIYSGWLPRSEKRRSAISHRFTG